MKVGFQMVGFKWSGFTYMAIATVPLEIRLFLSGFQIVFVKMAAICSDLKWWGFRISDPIRNPDHLQPKLFWTFQNPN